jgi:broad specificity phosphatase PhoE
MVTRVYLVRQGTTDWNQEEIFCGRADCPLNEKGRGEAQALVRYFRDISLDAIFSSPLARATETARPLAFSKGLSVIPNPAFSDLDFGSWQGVTAQRVKETDGELYRVWQERPQEVTFPGGEDLAQVRDRAWEGLQRIVGENPDKTLLVVSHRVVTKVLILTVLGLDLAHLWRIRQGTTAVNCLDYTGQFFIAALINDTCHLSGILGSSCQKGL